ncbi:MAG: hypothetical protein KGZ30_01045 [Anaplasmataceae bacterium]|nr:hypothetical protein [Anaplasmataceae bacterium]
MREGKTGKIEKVSIPDNDMPGWINVLREGGLNDEEINTMLSRLNQTYATLKEQEVVDRELQRMDAEIEERRGSGLTEEEREALRAGIQSRFTRK